MYRVEKSVMQNGEERILWIDILKGILIILVVIGHATGKFNGYIYQFHMAAFFMLSGYTENYSKRKTGSYIAAKWFRLMQPVLVVFFVGILISSLLERLGVYSFLFEDAQIYLGVKESIRQFLFYGNNYVWWMGACWFIIALFFALIVQRIIHDITNDSILILLISGALVLVQSCFSRTSLKFSLLDGKVVLIAQFYLCLGELARKTNCIRRINGCGWRRALLLNSCFAAVLIYAAQALHYSVDWPSADFEFSLVGCLIGVCDTLLVAGIAYMLSKANGKHISLLQIIGKNTMPIVFFHFVFFTVIHLVLAFFHVLSWQEVKTFLIPSSVAELWWLYAFGSICLSILFWQIMMKIRPLRILLGQDTCFLCLTKTTKITEEMENAAKKKDRCWQAIIIHRKQLILFLVYFCYGLLCMYPALKMGITCRDDFLWRMYASISPLEVIKQYAEAAIGQGRVLSIIQGINLAFICFPNRIMFGIIKGGLFLSNIVLMSMLMGRLSVNKGKYLLLISGPLFIQITLKASPPDAFSSFIAMPFTWILLSLLLYDIYLEKKNQKILVGSLFLYFAGMCAYESIILYSIFFFVIAVLRKKRASEIVKCLVPHTVTALLYLTLYILSRSVFPSNYSGNTIQIGSMKQVIEFIARMVCGGIPGLFASGSFSQAMMRYIRDYPVEYSILNEINFRIIVVLLLALGIFLLYMKRAAEKDSEGKKRSSLVFILLCLLICAIGLTVPNAVSGSAEMYLAQPGLIGLPSTYMISIILLTAISVLFELLLRCNSKRFRIACVCFFSIAMVLWGGFVQCSNHALGDLQTESSDRIERTEHILNISMISSETDPIYATGINDIYINQLVLMSDWNRYLEIQQKSCILTDQYSDGNAYLKMIDNGHRWIYAGDSHGSTKEEASTSVVSFISDHELYGKKVYFRCADGIIKQISLICGFNVECGFYVYTFDFGEDVCIDSIEII